jgi:hypothetical protein
MATATVAADVETALPPLTRAELRRLGKRTAREFREWNARQEVPMPVCRKCGMPFEEGQQGDLYEAWCGNCEADLVCRYLRRLVRHWGPAAAKAKLAALARKSPK